MTGTRHWLSCLARRHALAPGHRHPRGRHREGHPSPRCDRRRGRRDLSRGGGQDPALPVHPASPLSGSGPPAQDRRRADVADTASRSFSDGIRREGLAAMVPETADDETDTVVWLAFHDLERTEPMLSLVMAEARLHEREVICAALEAAGVARSTAIEVGRGDPALPRGSGGRSRPRGGPDALRASAPAARAGRGRAHRRPGDQAHCRRMTVLAANGSVACWAARMPWPSGEPV